MSEEGSGEEVGGQHSLPWSTSWVPAKCCDAEVPGGELMDTLEM